MTRSRNPGGRNGSKGFRGGWAGVAGGGELPGVVAYTPIGSLNQLGTARFTRNGTGGARTAAHSGGSSSTKSAAAAASHQGGNRGTKIELSEIRLIRIATQRVPHSIRKRIKAHFGDGFGGMWHFFAEITSKANIKKGMISEFKATHASNYGKQGRQYKEMK